MSSIAHHDYGHHRHDKRYEYPVLGLCLNGKVYPTKDWSLGGFRIGGYCGNHRRGDRIDIVGIVTGPGRIHSLTLRAVVIRIDRARRELAAHIVAMNDRAYGLLERIVMHRRDWPGIVPPTASPIARTPRAA